MAIELDIPSLTFEFGNQGGSIQQIQSDWEQTDDTQVDYIKNKPDLSVYATGEYVDEQIDEVEDITTILQNTKQNKLTAGNNITITADNIISAVSEGSDIFVAEINHTPFDDIYEAYQSGAYIVGKFGLIYYTLFEAPNIDSSLGLGIVQFVQFINNSVRYVELTKDFNRDVEGWSTRDIEYQEELVSGQNIATINGYSILTGGNLNIWQPPMPPSDRTNTYVLKSVNGIATWVQE